MEFFNQITNYFKQLTTNQKFALFFGIALFAAITTTAYIWSTNIRYATLMTKLEPEDASQIIQQLQEQRIPYRLTANGTGILVPEDQAIPLRLQMASKGLPHSASVGFSLFDDPHLGMSRFNEEINYNRALEGELRRTIMGLDAISDARVHIVLPKEKLFADDTNHASASITIQRVTGRTLSASQIQAIVHLVASSVPNLSADHITLVDSHMGILSQDGEIQHGQNIMMTRQRNIEKQLEERVANLLTPIIGEGHFVVRITAAMDFSQFEKTSENYDPKASVVRSEQYTNEQRQTSSGSSIPEGIPGVRSNTSVTNSNTLATSNSNAIPSQTRRLETRNYEISKTIQKEIGQAGKISRLSVAVLLDAIPEKAENGNITIKPRSDEEIGRITELVRRAIGFDDNRDDQVIVQSMPFEANHEIQDKSIEGGGEKPHAFWQSPIFLGGSAAAVLFILIGSIYAWQSNFKKQMSVTLLDVPRKLADLEREMNQITVKQSLKENMLEAHNEKDLSAEEFHEHFNPEEAALVLRKWLKA